MTNWFQREITLEARVRGFHLITQDIVEQLPELHQVNMGLLSLFIKHSSASLLINENADPTVRSDMEAHFNQMNPEGAPYYQHTLEGADDMPSHLKTALIGTSLTIPVSQGQLNMGVWQGIYLGEHRNAGGRRRVLATLVGV